MLVYRTIALALAVVFALVGVVFLAAPGAVLDLFEWVGATTGRPGMPAADVQSGLFRVLAVAYMYVVAWLAWMMFRRPGEPTWPTLLAHAKFASAAVSLLLFVAHAPYLAYLANGTVDGVLGTLALLLRRRGAFLRLSAMREEDHERSTLPS
jgi:hypothetical protein